MSPLVSIIIAAYNEEKHIPELLASIRDQNYSQIETLVIDDSSTDGTAQVAKQFKTKVITRPHLERSAQRNYGAFLAKGKYLLFLDADMQLSPRVVSSCVNQTASGTFSAIVIPERSFGENYWAKCKALERNCYIGDPKIEAARFVSKKVFNQITGYDPEMVSGEDWDLHKRIMNHKFGIGRTAEYILHNEGQLSYFKVLKKKYYYASKSDKYITNNITGPNEILRFILRPAIFKNWRLLLSDPIHVPGLFLLVWGEILVGGFGSIIFKPSFLKKITTFSPTNPKI
jgi:glycosyltransferase involved in cell wall biosynthesis